MARAFEDILRQEVGRQVGWDKDLIAQKNRLQEETFAQPARMRAEMLGGAIRNPLEQESVIAGRGAATGAQLGTVIDLLNRRGAQYEDIIGRASRAHEQEMADAANRNQNAGWQRYIDALLGGGTQVLNGGRAPIDPKEGRYNAYKNLGYSDDEAYAMAHSGVPQDKPGLGGKFGQGVRDTLANWMTFGAKNRAQKKLDEAKKLEEEYGISYRPY